MNFNAKPLAALLMVLCLLPFSACDNAGKNSEKEKVENLPPDPSTVFANFEALFRQQELPLAIPYDYPPYGNSLADDIKENFLPREGNIYPADRFELKDGFRAFLTFEDINGNFLLGLNVYGKGPKPVDHRIVAGIEGNEAIDVEFKSGGTWTETRRPIAEDTGMPSGDGTTTNWAIDAAGKIVQQ